MLKISIQGERASFHDMAARAYFGEAIEVMECVTFHDVCQRLFDQQCDLAVMAIENTLVGSILPNFGLLRQFPVTITGELYLKIEQNLMALPGQSLQDITLVRSHPMALQQCTNFLESYPNLKILEAFDTAGSARELREKNRLNTAAIASRAAAERYGLTILAGGIENQDNNFTRFFTLSRRESEPQFNGSKSTLYCTLNHQVGALGNLLEIFKTHRINLGMIQSLPLQTNPGEYGFLVELRWQEMADFKASIDAAQAYTNDLKILGIYEPAPHPSIRLSSRPRG